MEPTTTRPEATTGSSRIRFAEFEIDVEAQELRRDGMRVELAPQAVRALAILAAKSGELVRREQLYRDLWGDAEIDVDRGLNTLIRQIRLALGDDSARPRYLRTYPRRGYRFLAPLAGSSETAANGPRSRLWRGRGAVLASAAVLGAAAAVALTFLTGPRPGDESPPLRVRDTFLMARHLLESGDLGRRAEAVPLLDAVVREAPRFAPGHAHLAVALFWAERWTEARQAARTAMALDPTEAKALLIEGSLALMVDWDWISADTLLERAARSAPDDPAVRAGRAFVLVTAGQTGAALAELGRAEAADPVASWLVGDLGFMYLFAGNLRAAATACERAATLEPGALHPLSCALSARLGLGDTAAAHDHALRLMRGLGGDPEILRAGGPVSRGEELSRFLGWRAARARSVLAVDPRVAFAAALVFAEAGQDTEALAALARAAGRRDPGFVTATVDPRLARLHEGTDFHRITAPLVAAGAVQPGPLSVHDRIVPAKSSRNGGDPIGSSSRIH